MEQPLHDVALLSQPPKAMTTIIKRTTTRKQLAALLKAKRRKTKTKGVDVKSFAGKLKLEGDPLTIQKRMRDGWK